MLDTFESVAIIAVSAVQTPAQVAKLVDALGSGPSGGNTVEVRVLSWAPDSKVKPLPSGFTFCVGLRCWFERVSNPWPGICRTGFSSELDSIHEDPGGVMKRKLKTY
jgi:hypothetical protein